MVMSVVVLTLESQVKVGKGVRVVSGAMAQCRTQHRYRVYFALRLFEKGAVKIVS